MARLAFAGLVVLCALSLTGLSSAEEPKSLRGVALVIGNGGYADLPGLANAKADADAIEELLSDLGFDAVRRSDRDAASLGRDLDRFVEDAADADVAVLYYSGHGIEAGGENFLVPVDADISALDGAAERLVPLSAILARLREAVSVTILLLDACRDSPFPPGATLKLAGDAQPLPIAAGGLAETRGARAIDAVPAAGDGSLGMVIGFAAEPGKPALDGAPGENSPYAAAVLRHLSAMAGEEFGTVMRMVAEEVYLKTGGRQRPWTNESLRRQLYFGAPGDDPSGDEGDILAERRQLLLTIAALPNPERRQVERVAAQGGVPMDAVYGILKAMGTDVPDDPLKMEEVLRSEAERFARLSAERNAIVSPDPEISRLTALADAAEKEGILVKADDLREKAKARLRELLPTLEAQRTALDQRFTEGAAVFERSAQTKMLAHDNGSAAEDFREAYELVRDISDTLAWRYKYGEAIALYRLGAGRGTTEALDRSVSAGNAAETLVPGARELALTQSLLGQAHAEIYRRQGTPASLERAIGAHRAAIEAMGSAKTLEWAREQDLLGVALTDLAFHNSNSDAFQAALDAHDLAAAYFDSYDDKGDWALSTLRKAYTYRKMQSTRYDADIEVKLILLHESVDERIDKDANIILYAYNKSEMAIDLFEKSRRTQYVEDHKRGIEILESALSVLDKDEFPVQVAGFNNSLGMAYAVLGKMTKDSDVIGERAFPAFIAALELRTPDRDLYGRAATMASFAAAVVDMGRMRSEPDFFVHAATLYREALAIWERSGRRRDVLFARYQLGFALQNLGTMKKDVGRLIEATEAFKEHIRTADGDDRAMGYIALGATLVTLGQFRNSRVDLEAAQEAYSSGLLLSRAAGNTAMERLADAEMAKAKAALAALE